LIRLLSSLAAHLDTDVALEFYLRFTHALLLRHRNTLSSSLHTYMQLLRRVGRVLARVRGEVGRLCEDNLYLLEVLSDKRREGGEEGMKGEEEKTGEDEVEGDEARAKVEEVKESEGEEDDGASVVVVKSKTNGVMEHDGKKTDGKKSKKRLKTR